MNLKNVFILLLLTVFTVSHAQVVTSKKEAVKKGIYQKPDEPKTVDQTPKTVSQTKATSVKPSAQSAVASTTPAKPATKNTKTVKAKSKKNLLNERNADDVEIEAEESYVSLQMINNAMDFLGVRYRGGGTTTAGMDCSGMVTAVANIFGLKLPRSSNEMSRVGEKVEKSDVKKGDLVFFKTNGRSVINHVGLVVDVEGEEIKFIHSSTQKGVIISSTSEPYYKRTFAQANRLSL